MKFLKPLKRSVSLSWHLILFFSSVGPKLYDKHRLSLTHSCWQEFSESTYFSLITFPLSLRPFMSLAKLMALNSGSMILFAAVIEIEIKSHCQYMPALGILTKDPPSFWICKFVHQKSYFSSLIMYYHIINKNIVKRAFACCCLAPAYYLLLTELDSFPM